MLQAAIARIVGPTPPGEQHDHPTWRTAWRQVQSVPDLETFPRTLRVAYGLAQTEALSHSRGHGQAHQLPGSREGGHTVRAILNHALGRQSGQALRNHIRR